MSLRSEALAKISDVRWEDLASSRYIKPKRFHFKQLFLFSNGVERADDFVEEHDGVYILVYHTDRKCFIFVRQFRPAFYERRIRELQPEAFPSALDWSRLPGTLGVTIELCAGITDKAKSTAEIAAEEVLEELGYSVPAERLRWIASFGLMDMYSTAKGELYYVEVDETMKVSEGGGIESEMIEVVEMSPTDARSMVFSADVHSTFAFCVLWWFEERLQREKELAAKS